MTPLDRFKRAFSNAVREQFPALSFFGAYEYRVATTAEGMVDARPVEGRLGLPDLTGLKLRPSITGDTVTLTSGASIVVMFVNGDPSRPFVAFGDPDSDPTLVRLSGGILAAARITDPIVAGPFGGTITGGSTKVQVG